MTPDGNLCSIAWICGIVFFFKYRSNEIQYAMIDLILFVPLTMLLLWPSRGLSMSRSNTACSVSYVITSSTDARGRTGWSRGNPKWCGLDVVFRSWSLSRHVESSPSEATDHHVAIIPHYTHIFLVDLSAQRSYLTVKSACNRPATIIWYLPLFFSTFLQHVFFRGFQESWERWSHPAFLG